MLVLTRKKEETIRIGPNITITILRVKGRAVKIGIDAPAGTRILRGELVAGDRPPEPAPSQPAVHVPARRSDLNGRRQKPVSADRDAAPADESASNSDRPGDPGPAVPSEHPAPRQSLTPRKVRQPGAGYRLVRRG